MSDTLTHTLPAEPSIAGTSAASTPQGIVVTFLSTDELHESPFNPRKTFLALDELAADIRAVGGIAQPLLVRPRVPALFAGDDAAACGYEVVFGHRRLRAAQMAGLATVPCMVRSLTDAEARRLQISENLQRQDVHPIEEAEGFQALIDNDGLNAEQLAEQFGKSLSYVYGRLKLLQACPAVREACLAGSIGSEVALLVARIRSIQLQKKALESLKSNGHVIGDGGKQSYRRIRDFLRERFTLELKGAIFPIDSAELVPLAGACTSCPKRTGNAPEFDDIANPHEQGHWGNRHNGMPDLCTDPDCFEAKKKQHLANQAAQLEASGKTVIAGGKARQIVSATGEIKGEYVSAKQARALLADAGVKGKPQVVAIQNPRDGKVHEAVSRASLAAAGVKLDKQPKDASGAQQRNRAAIDWEAERRQNDRRRETRNAHRVQVLQALHEAASRAPRQAADIQLIAEAVLDDAWGNDPGLQALAALWGCQHLAELEARVQRREFTPDQLALLVLGVAVAEGMGSSGVEDEDDPKRLYAAAAAYGVSTAEASEPHPPAAQAQEKGAARGKGKKSAASGGKARSEAAGAATGAASAALDFEAEAGA